MWGRTAIRGQHTLFNPSFAREAVTKLAKEHSHQRVQRLAPAALRDALEKRPVDDTSLEGLAETVALLAKQRPHALSLRQLYAFGKQPTAQMRLQNAQFLHHELPVRLAQRAEELMHLGYGLSDVPGIQHVARCFAQYALELYKAPRPETTEQEHHYTCLLANVILDAQSIPRAMSVGLNQFRERLEIPLAAYERRELEGIMSRFFTGRISLRLLIEHHIASATMGLRGGPVAGVSGVIRSNVSPSLAASEAADNAKHVCSYHLGAAPRVQVVGSSGTFCYVPSHLSFMINELLKNSCRAVVEAHHPAYRRRQDRFGAVRMWPPALLKEAREDAATHAARLPVVRVVTAMGDEDVTIKISDEGGGISRSEMDDIWAFMFSTAPPAAVSSDNFPALPEPFAASFNAAAAVAAAADAAAAAAPGHEAEAAAKAAAKAAMHAAAGHKGSSGVLLSSNVLSPSPSSLSAVGVLQARHLYHCREGAGIAAAAAAAAGLSAAAAAAGSGGAGSVRTNAVAATAAAEAAAAEGASRMVMTAAEAAGPEHSEHPAEDPGHLAGHGMGLPLSRVYARYFGGDLKLLSMEGFGTDTYLHLSRLGHECENLPEVVRHSPAENELAAKSQ